MKKCPKCGKEFEGKYCPECGEMWREDKVCPKCGAKASGEAKYCVNCGYDFYKLSTPSKPAKKGAAVAAWAKSNKKLVILAALVLLIVLIVSIAVPLGTTNRHNGTYYLSTNGEYDKGKYFILKGNSYTDEKGYSCDVEFDGDSIKMYAEMFGMRDVAAEGTLEGDILKLKIMGADAIYLKEGHKHDFGDWEVIREPSCAKGLSFRACACGKEERQETEPVTKDHTLTVTKVGISPTCTEKGITQEIGCSVCGIVIKPQEEIELIPHTKVVTKAKKDATCTEKGLTAEITCSVCKQVLERQQEIDVIPHTKVVTKAKKDATCTEKGWTAEITCSMCKQVLEPLKEIEALGLEHEFNSDLVCTRCGYSGLKGIQIKLNAEGTAYTITEVGTYEEDKLEIPSEIAKLPVTKIGPFALKGNSNIKRIKIPDSVTEIGEQAFSECVSLLYVSIGNGLTSIGEWAFEGCNRLMSIEIPDSVTSIGEGAFFKCTSLTSIAIPDSVTEIGGEAFSGCKALTSINYQGTKEEWKKVEKGSYWRNNAAIEKVICTDGELTGEEIG